MASRQRVRAHGRVQGVWFRDSCRREAEAHAVAGWVANREDGSVEAVFEGEPEAVEALVAWSRSGPSRARVERLDAWAEPPEGLAGFEVR